MRGAIGGLCVGGRRPSQDAGLWNMLGGREQVGHKISPGQLPASHARRTSPRRQPYQRNAGWRGICRHVVMARWLDVSLISPHRSISRFCHVSRRLVPMNRVLANGMPVSAVRPRGAVAERRRQSCGRGFSLEAAWVTGKYRSIFNEWRIDLNQNPAHFPASWAVGAQQRYYMRVRGRRQCPKTRHP